MNDLKLYYATGACSLAPHVALEEAGASFEPIRVNLAAGHQRSAAYLAINPLGRVPTLAIGHRRITENIAVLTGIARLFPQAGLLPTESALALARAYERMSWLATTAHVSVSQIFRTERFTTDPLASAVLKEAGRAQVASHFHTIESWLGGEWVLDEYSVLDPYLLVFWRWGERLEMKMSSHPRWAEHTARMLARPAVATALAREQQPAPEQFASAAV